MEETSFKQRLDPAKYSYKDAIVEHALVPSRNGHDTIWVDIIRPKTKPGVKLPTIMDASPYFNTLGRGWEGKCKTPGSLVIHEPLCPCQTVFITYGLDRPRAKRHRLGRIGNILLKLRTAVLRRVETELQT